MILNNQEADRLTDFIDLLRNARLIKIRSLRKSAEIDRRDFVAECRRTASNRLALRTLNETCPKIREKCKNPVANANRSKK